MKTLERKSHGIRSGRLLVRAGSLAIPCFAVLVYSSLSAVQNQRGFAGFYQARISSAGAKTVRVTLTLRVFNYTENQITEGTLELRENLPPHKTLGTVIHVSVNARESVQVSGDFVLPRSEYLRWQKGGGPDLTVRFRDADGNPQSQSVELVRGHSRIEE